MIIYISGKITDLPYQEAYDKFDLVERTLNDFDHLPINPMKLVHDHDKSWESYMRVDIAALTSCEAIYMLQGWQESKGARLEHNLAKCLAMEIYYENHHPVEEIPLLKTA